MKSLKSFYASLAIITAIIIVVNILFSNLTLRLDLTQDRRYTLSKASKDLLKTCVEPITIVAYFSQDLPPDVARVRNEFKEMLTEYVKASKGKVQYEFKNPNEKPELENEAQVEGVGPVLINLRDKNQVKQQKAYLGAVIKVGDRKEVIPLIQPGMSIEFELSSAIKKLIVTDKPLVGYLAGQGEPGLSALMQARQASSVMYNMEEFSLVDSADMLSKYKIVAIVAPRDSFTDWQLYQLEDYMNKGGKLLIALNRVNGDFQTATGSELTTGLESWLASKGIQVDGDFVVDKKCNSVYATRRYGAQEIRVPITFPYLPIVSNFGKHPITQGIEMIMLQFASSLQFTGDTSMVKFNPLLFSSDESGREPAPIQFNIDREWSAGDFRSKGLILAATFEGKLGSNRNRPDSRIVLFTDGDFVVNGEGQQPQQLPEDNINIFVNSLDWLNDETGLIALRTKVVTARPLDQISDSKKTFVKYLNFLLPLILIVGYGVYRSQRNRIIRMKRMEDNYV